MQTLRYSAPRDAVWHHFVFGNVPGHQLDWIWRPSPEPHAPTSQHVQHLLHLVQLFDVADPSASTLTIGNLSMGDTRHRAGHGALALLMHFRLPGCQDHSGRPNPPLVHALVAVDRAFTAGALVSAASELVRNTVGITAPPNRPIDLCYARYLDATTVSPEAAGEIWRAYTADFDRLPLLDPGLGDRTWTVPEGEQMPPLVEFISDVEPAAELQTMAGLADILYRSRAKWSAITTARVGQGARDQGTLIRFSPAELAQGASPKRRLSRLPSDAVQLACQLLPLLEDLSDAGVEEGPEPVPLAPPNQVAPPPPVVPPAPVVPPVPLVAPSARTTPLEPPRPPVSPAQPAEDPLSWRGPLLVFGVTVLVVFSAAFLLARLGIFHHGSPTPAPDPVSVPAPTPQDPTPVPTPVSTPPEPTPAPTPPEPSVPHPHLHPVAAAPEPAAPIAVPTAQVTVSDDLTQRCRVSGPAGANALRGPTALPPGSYVLSCTTSTSPREPVEMYTAALEADLTYALTCMDDQCRLRRSK